MATVPDPSNAAIDATARPVAGPNAGPCRGCRSDALALVVDLGRRPLAERFVRPEDLDRPDQLLDLRILVCGVCWLVQLGGEPVSGGDETGGPALPVSPANAGHNRQPCG